MGDQKIEIPRGDSRVITATITDTDGSALDLTNLTTAYLSVKETKDATVYVIKNKAGSVEGDPTDGVISFAIAPADTQDEDVGEWWYDIQLTFDDGTVYTPIIDNFEILADISRPTHTITASSGANGSIDPTGATSVEDKASQVFTITPDDGYTYDTFLVDSVDATADLVSQNGGWTYTFSDVEDDHTIAVTWQAE